MARARNLKPGFFKNEDLASLGSYAMLMFAGLWTLADRDGRLEDRPKRIKAELFPYFPGQNVDRILDSLHQGGFITRYAVDEQRYILIPNWGRHQNPHFKEQPSKLPAPVMPEASLRQALNLPDSCRADSPFSDSLNPIPVEGRVGRTRDHFREFWGRYSKLRDGGGENPACTTWISFGCDSHVEQIMQCLASYEQSRDVENGAIMNADKWLASVRDSQWRATWPAAKKSKPEPLDMYRRVGVTND